MSSALYDLRFWQPLILLFKSCQTSPFPKVRSPLKLRQRKEMPCVSFPVIFWPSFLPLVSCQWLLRKPDYGMKWLDLLNMLCWTHWNGSSWIINNIVLPPPLDLILFRAAQKLNLSSKRKKHHGPLLQSRDFSIYPTNFSGILQTCPPPAPPCLLRAVSKVKDNPGIGKVFGDLPFLSLPVLWL